MYALFFASNIVENIAAYKKIKAWNVINHNNYIIHILLGTVL